MAVAGSAPVVSSKAYRATRAGPAGDSCRGGSLPGDRGRLGISGTSGKKNLARTADGQVGDGAGQRQRRPLPTRRWPGSCVRALSYPSCWLPGQTVLLLFVVETPDARFSRCAVSWPVSSAAARQHRWGAAPSRLLRSARPGRRFGRLVPALAAGSGPAALGDGASGRCPDGRAGAGPRGFAVRVWAGELGDQPRL